MKYRLSTEKVNVYKVVLYQLWLNVKILKQEKKNVIIKLDKFFFRYFSTHLLYFG